MHLNFFDLESLKQKLEKLPQLHRMAFAASICERMLPNYNAFSRMENWGDPSVPRKVLDEIWQVLQGRQIDETRIRQLQKDLEGVCPDSDSNDFCNAYYLFEAQEALFSIEYILIAYLNKSLEYIIRVVMSARFETIQKFIEERDENFRETVHENELEEIVTHPLAVREMAKENEDLQLLKSIEYLECDFLESLRNSNNGKSLLDYY
ncbi:hypothetical protein NIES2100_52270 [Calothrix sp. NIES-2100]|uniref:DUF416 family protein n=1 Tax=Calothrix sp. NIES-2100 TaxID=1954172 RepID=UPI000B6141CB|nr:hypothetical protein NIES2100_52270 [Calothrix sp. NIES-2100]